MGFLIICFRNNISQQVADSLRGFGDIVALESNKRVIDSFVKNTDFSKYDRILGMGLYRGWRQYDLRVEASCDNQYKSKNVVADIVKIPYFINPCSGVRVTDGIGHSYCNLLSYGIVKKLQNIEFTFLHIPKNFSTELAVQLISKQLYTLEMSQVGHIEMNECFFKKPLQNKMP